MIKNLSGLAVLVEIVLDNSETVSQSLCLRDPDGNKVELYVDTDESVWMSNPVAVVSPIKPLHL